MLTLATRRRDRIVNREVMRFELRESRRSRRDTSRRGAGRVPDARSAGGRS